MKLFIIKVYVLFIRILYAPMKFRKTKNKILYLSRQSDEKSTDMLLLEKCIKNISPDTQQFFRLRRLKDEKSLTLSYIFSIFGDMWNIADSKVVMVDTYSIPVSCLNHKKDVKVIQMWHALGAVKKFSLQAAGKAQGRDLGVSKAMHMHKNYDYVIAPSKATAEFYKEGFGCEDKNIKIYSLPLVDYLLDGKDKKEEFLNLNPQYKNKKIAVYVPTFRNNDKIFADNLNESFLNQNEFSLVVSAHPLSKTVGDIRYKLNGDFISRDLIKFADVVITDYSACAFEAAVLGKKLYFYIPDYDIYKNEQGLNVDIKKELPEYSFTEAKDLVKSLKNSYDFHTLSDFSEKYVENKKTNNTEKLAEFICSLLKN